MDSLQEVKREKAQRRHTSGLLLLLLLLCWGRVNGIVRSRVYTRRRRSAPWLLLSPHQRTTIHSKQLQHQQLAT